MFRHRSPADSDAAPEIRLCAQCGKAILAGEPHSSRLAGAAVHHEHRECRAAAEDFRATRLALAQLNDLPLLAECCDREDVAWLAEHHRLVAVRLCWAGGDLQG